MFLLRTALLLGAVGNACGQIFVPKEVQQYAAQALEDFSEYVHFHGAESQVAKSEPKIRAATTTYWMENIGHNGKAAFNTNSGYKVFRNVKTDFGAKGDGRTDDTAAIQNAIASGGRCAEGSCQSTTVTPAVVYFPCGTYIVSASIIDYYYTQFIGNPHCMPTLKAASNFAASDGSIGLLDGDPYRGQFLGFGATNVFWRQVRNLVIDTTAIPASTAMTAIHWPTGQATSLQNLVINLASGSNSQHQGIFIESGSGGYMNDLVFHGGLYGLNVGNQQFTMKNITVNNAITAISQIWDWGWTYQNININNCQTGLSLSNGGSSSLSVGSIVMLDSTISNTPVGIVTGKTSGSQPQAANSLVLENIKLNNVGTALKGPNGVLIGNVGSISAYASGNSYTPNKGAVSGTMSPNARPSSLVAGDGRYYQRSKPQYESLDVSSFISARQAGAKGDGVTDDTSALQNAINNAVSQGKVLYVDHGDYLVTRTISIPAGAKIVGEAYSVILSSGSFFNDMSNPKPVVQIGQSGQSGSIEWSDMIVSTKGQQQGAILIEYNLKAPAGTPSGLWDVHSRIGGFAGSNLQVSQCGKTPGTVITSSNLNRNCIAAFMGIHITSSSSGLYLENVWLWTADHDVEDPNLSQITVYAGRGLLDESAGPVWLIGTAVEHHTLYQYQFANAANVMQGQIQTETAYYQPNPDASIPFPAVSALHDPVFNGATTVSTNGTAVPAREGWGLRILNSKNIFTYGAGLYSFFDNYSTDCSNQGNGVKCQTRIMSVEGSSSGISLYNLNTVGTHWPITVDGTDQAIWSDNQDGFVQTIALFRK